MTNSYSSWHIFTDKFELELELDWPPVVATPVSPGQLHLHKESTRGLLGTNRHPYTEVLVIFCNNGACHVKMQPNKGKGEELMIHLANIRPNIPLRQRQFMREGVGEVIL